MVWPDHATGYLKVALWNCHRDSSLTRNYDRLTLHPIHFIVTYVCVYVRLCAPCTIISYQISIISADKRPNWNATLPKWLQSKVSQSLMKLIYLVHFVESISCLLCSFYECTSQGNLYVEYSPHWHLKWQNEVEKSPFYL